MTTKEILRPVDILLIEDNPGDVRLIREAMDEAGFRNNTTVAGDGMEAMKAIKRVGRYKDLENIDIIILDLNLPKKDGREVLGEIKSDPGFKHIPVIVLSSSSADEDIEKSYNSYANCYITKPLDVAAYVDVIKKIEFFWLQVARLPKKRINMLLIEDNPGDVRLVEEMLKEGSGADFELKTSTSLREGMRLIEDDHVDIVVLDLNLPDSTSYETFAKLYSRFPRLPIVVITGIKDDSLGIKAVKEGAQSYLSKQDLTPEFLIKTIRYSIERNRLKLAYEDLMHIILHEIRSPLAIIKEGASQMLDGIQGKLSGKQREYAEMVFDNGQRMERLINDLLEIAKIEIGTMKLETKRFDMAQLIRRTATGLKAVTDKKGLKLITSILEPKIEVVADPDRITQVIHNLISNAIKCTEKGEIVISLGADADNVECSVKDTGAGVDPALLPRIFDKYKQGGHRVQRSKGVGLGLFLCKTIVELHGGRISVDSKQGKGTTFTFVLPRDSSKAGQG